MRGTLAEMRLASFFMGLIYMTKRLSALAINALKEALCNIYWYKSDLRSFLQNCIGDRSVILSVDWNSYKRQIVSDIIDYLCGDQDKYLGDLRRLMHEVCKMTNFKHLEQLEDGRKKAQRAAESVKNLRDLVDTSNAKAKEEEDIAKRRKEALEKLKSSQAVLGKLESIKSEYFKLVTAKEHHKRGYELEKVLYEIFDLFDLDPKASFRNIGEQIDGAFSLEGADYLFEAKWQDHLSDASDLDAFKGKISRKLDNTLGLFLSINGFSEDAVRIHSSGRSTVLLMDGIDLMAVLEGRIDFVSMLIRKRRHAAQTGNIFFRITEDL